MSYSRFLLSRQYLLPVLAIALLASCNSPYDRPAKAASRSNFPRVQSIGRFPHTSFVATMEQPLEQERNAIYTPAFLYAWDEFRQIANSDVAALSDNALLHFINTSASWKNSLDTSEIEKGVRQEGDLIFIRTFFSKSIVFPEPFDTTAFAFMGNTVKGFGMPYYSDLLSGYITILFYKDDDHFIIELSTGSEKERLILAKGCTENTLAASYTQVNQWIKEGSNERKNSGQDWKYYLKPEDDVVIPELRFNITNPYNDLVEQRVRNKAGDTFVIKEATQRTAFLLNETGAKVESEAEMMMEASAEVPPSVNEKPRPKHLVLDKSFLVIMKKREASFPYCMMAIANDELMTVAK